MGLEDILARHFWTIVFYAVILGLLYFNRKKFEYQGILALYRTKIGIGTMDRWAKRAGPLVRFLGYVGVFVGFGMMAAAAIFLGALTIDLLAKLSNPSEFVTSTPAIGPALPGVPIPGTEFTLPLITGFISIFLIILVHEFAHGLVARAHKIPVKNTGYLQLLVIPGAFVEPDEKKMAKASAGAQLSVFAAGAFTNFLTAALALLIIVGLSASVVAVMPSLFEPQGFSFAIVSPNSSAERAGIPVDTVFNHVNGERVVSIDHLSTTLSALPSGSLILFENDGTNGAPEASYEVRSQPHPDDPSRGLVGIAGIYGIFSDKTAIPYSAFSLVFGHIVSFLFLFLLLSISIGGINLLPLGPLDGGRMFMLGMTHLFGDATGKKVWGYVSFALLGIFAVLILQFILFVGNSLLP